MENQKEVMALAVMGGVLIGFSLECLSKRYCNYSLYGSAAHYVKNQIISYVRGYTSILEDSRRCDDAMMRRCDDATMR